MRHVLRSLVLLAVLAVAGCSAAAPESSSAGDRAYEGPASYEAHSDSGGGGESGAADEDRVVGESERQFVTSGSISLTVEDPHAAAREAALLVERVGGHVQERVEEGGGDEEPGRAYLVVRIPSSEITATLDELEQLGEVQNTSLTSTEVTDQARDLDARIRALEISVTRLEDLLGRAGSIADIVEAEQVLTERQSELESLQSQRAGLADQVEMSTFRLDLWTEDTVPDEPGTGFWAGLVAGFTALMTTLRGILQGIGVLLPWLIFAGLVTAVVVTASRWARRRKAATAPPSAPHHGAAGPTTSLPVTPAVANEPAPAPEPAAPATPAAPAPRTTKTRTPRTPPAAPPPDKG